MEPSSTSLSSLSWPSDTFHKCSSKIDISSLPSPSLPLSEFTRNFATSQNASSLLLPLCSGLFWELPSQSEFWLRSAPGGQGRALFLESSSAVECWLCIVHLTKTWFFFFFFLKDQTLNGGIKDFSSYFQNGRQCYSVGSVAWGFITIALFDLVPLA